jgi:TM2 domain-containing membrane protein YozV
MKERKDEMSKNPVVALLLSFIPGVGHAYLGRPFRCLLYGGAFFGSLMFLFLAVQSGDGGDIGLFFLFTAALSWLINMVDMVVTLLSSKPPAGPYNERGDIPFDPGYIAFEQQREKTSTVLLSLIPGLGHMSLGLMQRGITFLVAFLGLFAIIVFIGVVTNTSAFLIFLLGLPVIWIYSIFDSIQQLHRKQRGEELNDRPLFEEIENHMGTGKKNKVLAAILSLFPGAGHLYLGLQKRGLQLMGGFLIAIYLMDSLRLSIFLFLMPLLWFYAFFDAMQQMSRYERGELNDQAVVAQLAPYQKWIGIGLLALGIYYLGDRVMGNYISQTWPDIYAEYVKLKYNLPTAVVAFLMIALGFRLVFGGGSGSRPYTAPEPLPPHPSEFTEKEGER